MQQKGQGPTMGRIPKPPLHVRDEGEDPGYQDQGMYQQPYGYPQQPMYYAPPPPPMAPGGLGYSGGGGGGNSKKSGGMSMAQALMVIILAVIVSLIAGWQLFAMKSAVTAIDPAVVQGNYDRSVKNATDITSTQTTVNNVVNSQGDYLKKADAITEAKVNDLIDKALEDFTPTTTTTTTTTTPTTTPVGSINYTIENPQTYWTFSSPGLVVVKIFNNKSDSRYIRPQLNISTWGGTNAGTVSLATCSIISNTLSQPAVTFAAGTAVPVTAVTSIYWQANGGGVVGTGEFLVPSGVELSVTYQVQVTSTTAALWTVEPSGSDRAMY